MWVSPRTDAPGKFKTGLRLPLPEGKTLDLFAWDELKRDARLETTDEELRILHVAVTRAQRRLVLSGVASFEEVPDPTEANPHATALTQIYDPTGLDDGIEMPAPTAAPGMEFEPPATHVEVTLIRPEDSEGIVNVIEPEPDRPSEEMMAVMASRL